MHVIIQGAGRGIGLALAKQALTAGASHLYLTARDPAASAGYREMPPSATIRWFSMDFCDPASIAACGAALCAATPRIDRVISTAGLLHDADIHPEKTITALGTTAMMRLYQVNAMGPALFWQALWPLLRASKGVKIGSLSARVGSISDNRLGGWYSYRASKAALNQYLRCMAIELARYNPDAAVAALHPGTVDTALSKPFQGHVAPDKLQDPAMTAAQLWAVLDRLQPAESGRFFAYDGSEIEF